MQFVLDNPSEAQRIGFAGKKMAIKFFNYCSKAKEIDDFLSSEN